MNYQHTAGDRTPFTYVIRFPMFNQIYYGVKYAKGCKPKDLGNTYFSSSKTVQRLLKQDVNAIFEIRKVFNSVEKAKQFETRFLQRINARDNPRFLNKHNNDGLYPVDNSGFKNPAFGKPGTMLGKKHKQQSKDKIALAITGEKNPFHGKKHKPETALQISLNQRGHMHHAFKGWYITPNGKFGSAREAERVTGEPRRKISKQCKEGLNGYSYQPIQ